MNRVRRSKLNVTAVIETIKKTVRARVDATAEQEAAIAQYKKIVEEYGVFGEELQEG